MIDTICLKVHDLNKHRRLAAYLLRIRNGSTVWKQVNRDNVERLEDVEIIPGEGSHGVAVHMITGEVFEDNIRVMPLRPIVKYYDTQKVKKSAHLGKMYLPSSHYGVAFMVNEEQDYIYFNFSIPKFLYGTNVFQYLEHYDDKGFDSALFKWNPNKKRLYARLMQFIDHFFKVQFRNIPIIMELVEIARLDLCYNMIFPNEELAREYLRFCQRIRKKGSRAKDINHNPNTHGSNVLYNTSLYAAKIYHKGDEFRKNDAKQLRKINAKHGRDIYDIQAIQNMADRILRYEITFHSKYMSYVFKNKVMRKNCGIHGLRKKEYRRIMNEREKERKKGRDMIDIIHEDLLTRKEAASLTKYRNIEQKFVSDFAKFKEKRLKFYVTRKDDGFYDFTPYDMSGDPSHMKTEIYIGTHKRIATDYKVKVIQFRNDLKVFRRDVQFCPDLLGSMVDVLRNFIMDYKLEERPNFVEAYKRINDHNAKIDKFRNQRHFDHMEDRRGLGGRKINPQKLVPIIKLMEKGETLDQIAGDLNIQPRTLRRYKADLRKIGITEKGVYDYKYDWNHDFETYHQWFIKAKTRNYFQRMQTGRGRATK